MTERNIDFKADDMDKKLILLFIFEKMEFPLTDQSISEIVVANPTWMNYMDFRDAIFGLVESKFIHRGRHGADTLFRLTNQGRACLGHFYTKIPASVREEITNYARDNKQDFRRNQEYTYDYFKNSDQSHTILLKIKEYGNLENLLEIKMKVNTRAEAIKSATKWKEKAPVVYESLLTILSEEEK
ncbi:MAG: DUF4364 family protein [Firmicutes bacterium]|nr:DUF4364 family protein [Bacillota bacterium]